MKQSSKPILPSPLQASPTSCFEYPPAHALTPFERAISGGHRTNNTHRKEQVPRPRSAVVLGLASPLSTADQNLRRFHTEPHVATSVSFAPAAIPPTFAISKYDQRKESRQRHPWRVTKVPPPTYPIERTHEVLHDVSPLVVADRIAACLREHSIGATYDHQDAICRAELEDLTRFNIRLFEADGGIIVELQRRSGSSPSFHNAAHAILLWAKGQQMNADPKVSSPCRPHGIPPSLLNQAVKCCCCRESKGTGTKDGDKSDEQNDEEDAATKVSKICGGDLAIVDCLLRKPMLDARLLAMESLRYLTDEESSGTDAAAAVAKAIMCGSDEQSVNIRDALFSLVVNGTLDNNKCHECPSDCEVDREFNHDMHEIALVVLANAIGMILKARAAEPDAFLCCSHEVEELLTALCEDIADAEEKPTDAYQALRCMFELIESSNSAKLDAKARGVLALIEAMQESGICHHKLMEEELKRIEEVLLR